jgi:K+-sensing histidine kinase KdpD
MLQPGGAASPGDLARPRARCREGRVPCAVIAPHRIARMLAASVMALLRPELHHLSMESSDRASSDPAVRESGERAAVRRYAFAFLVTGVALLVTFVLGSYAERSPFLAFYTAVALTAWYGGLGPALAATALSVLAADYYFVPPTGVLPKGPDGFVATADFLDFEYEVPPYYDVFLTE